MNKYFKILFVIVLFFSFSFVFADTTIHLDVNPCCNNSTNSCKSEEKKATPYCAILDSKIPNGWDWTWESSMGALLNSFNGISGHSEKDETGADVYYYWNWSLNSGSELLALNKYELNTNDIITLTFSNSTEMIAPPNDTTINLIIDSIKPIAEPEPEITPPEHHSSGGGYIIQKPIAKPIFDSKKAFDFISSQQKTDGSFGEEIYTDWTAIALASNPDYQDQKTKLAKYFSENKANNYQLLTDWERHSMALLALNLNPYNFYPAIGGVNGENYIEKITKSFDGVQFGDPAEINDDIFALIVLQNAGFNQDEKIITKTIDFIISKQKEDGSWDESIDLTGAGIEALVAFDKKTDPLPASPLAGGGAIANALIKAGKFIKEKEENGNWKNISSTAWALEGILASGENIQDFTKEYFGENQDSDGGIKGDNLNNRLWQTAYVLTSLSGKTWNQIMQKIEKPTEIISIRNPLLKKINNSGPIKFKKKFEKFQKKTFPVEISNPAPNLNLPAPKKQSWFRRFLNKIFGF